MIGSGRHSGGSISNSCTICRLGYLVVVCLCRAQISEATVNKLNSPTSGGSGGICSTSTAGADCQENINQATNVSVFVKSICVSFVIYLLNIVLNFLVLCLFCLIAFLCRVLQFFQVLKTTLGEHGRKEQAEPTA